MRIQTVRPSHSSLIVLPHQISISTCRTISIPRWKIIGKLSPLFVFWFYLQNLFFKKKIKNKIRVTHLHKGTQLNLPEGRRVSSRGHTEPGGWDMLRSPRWSQTSPYSSQRDALCHSHINTITRTVSSSANKTRMRLASHVHAAHCGSAWRWHIGSHYADVLGWSSSHAASY